MLDTVGLLTLKLIDNHALPPLPVEPDMSIIGASHAPIIAGAEMETVGAIGLIGDANVMFVEGTVDQD